MGVMRWPHGIQTANETHACDYISRKCIFERKEKKGRHGGVMGRGLRICLASYRHRSHADEGAAAKGPGSFPHDARIHRALVVHGVYDGISPCP